MSVIPDISGELLSNQRHFFRIAKEQHKLGRKVFAMDTGLGHSVIDDYANGKVVMGGATIFALMSLKHIPPELLSILFDGTGRMVIDDGTGE